jgi:hypothetical protein
MVVALSSLVFDGVRRPSYGLWHGQEHGQANKQSIRSLKISSILDWYISHLISPVMLKLFFMPSNYRVVLL